MFLPISDIFVDSEVENLTAEVKLDSRLMHVEDEKNKLSLAQREAAQVAAAISADCAQQAELDALALRYDTDCLKAEDRVEELTILRACSRKDLEVWAEAEKARRNAATNAANIGDGQGREVAQLRRQLEDASLEAAAALSELSSQTAGEKSMEVKLQGAKAALSAVRGDVTTVRRRLDTAGCTLAARKVDIEKAEATLKDSTSELVKVEKHVAEAKAAFDAEITAGKALTQAAADAERKCARKEEEISIAEKDAEKAQYAAQTAKMTQLHIEAEAARMEGAAQQAARKAEQVARSLADSLQRHLDVQATLENQEEVGKSAAERQAACEALATAERQRLRHLEQHISELVKQRDRIQQEKVELESTGGDREAAAQYRAQSAALASRTAGLLNELAHHQETLYRVEFQLFKAKMAAAAESSPHPLDEVEDYVSIKHDLCHQFYELDASHRALTSELRGVEAAAGRAVSTADDAQRKLHGTEEQHKLRLRAVEGTRKELEIAVNGRDNARLAVSKAALAVNRLQERMAKRAREVLESSCAADAEALAHEERVKKLEARLQELKTDHIAASQALQEARGALAARNKATTTAEASLRTLELKSEGGETLSLDSEYSCVAGVCAKMQKQVEELRAALVAAEQDCGVLEQALAAQQAAAASSRQQKKIERGLESPLVELIESA